jgi:hypothetical protein
LAFETCFEVKKASGKNDVQQPLWLEAYPDYMRRSMRPMLRGKVSSHPLNNRINQGRLDGFNDTAQDLTVELI